MFLPDQIHSRAHQLEHFIAAFDAFGIFFKPGAAQICASEIDGIQEFFDAAPIFDLEAGSDMHHIQFQIPGSFPVFLQELERIVVQGCGLVYIFQFSHGWFLLKYFPVCMLKGQIGSGDRVAAASASVQIGRSHRFPRSRS